MLNFCIAKRTVGKRVTKRTTTKKAAGSKKIAKKAGVEGRVFLQFVVLGLITTLLTSGADLVVTLAAGPLSGALRRSPRLRRVQTVASGGTLLGLGVYVALRE